VPAAAAAAAAAAGYDGFAVGELNQQIIL